MVVGDDQQAELDWRARTLDQISGADFLKIARLRTDVFVVEQACIYPEFDVHDAADSTLHITATDRDNTLVACARVIFPGRCVTGEQSATAQSVPEPVTSFARVGRVVVATTHRGKGLARELMQFVMSVIADAYAEAGPLQQTEAVNADVYSNVNPHTHDGVSAANSPQPAYTVMLAAQSYIVPFYASLGFTVCSTPYLEDGIEHVDMRLDVVADTD